MAELSDPSNQRIAEIFETCRALHREAYPESLLDFDRLDLTTRITRETSVHARGGLSDVYRGVMDDGTLVAVKTLRLPVYSLYADKVYQTAMRRFFREINIWSTRDHPCVAPCLGYTLTGENLSIISSWHANGSLFQYLRTSSTISEPNLILDVAEGTEYLHTCSSPLIHGDLKAANILVSEHGIARLADFGISKQIDDMNRHTGFTTTGGATGTMPWMAPELDEDSLPTLACDVYSCAGVFLEISCPGKTPYHYLKSRDIIRAKEAGSPPDLLQYPEMVGKMALWEIMCACWTHDPLHRPNITSIVRSLYGLFELTSRVDQTVTLRPVRHTGSTKNRRHGVYRLGLDSMKLESLRNALEEAGTRQKGQNSEPEPEALTGEEIDVAMGHASPSLPPSSTVEWEPEPKPHARASTTPGTSGDNQLENQFKRYKVHLDDLCWKVLPAALRKYKINDDWQQYALFICHGNTERCLSFDEKPLLLFRKLKDENKNPVFMLRHIKDIRSPIAVAQQKQADQRSQSSPPHNSQPLRQKNTDNFRTPSNQLASPAAVINAAGDSAGQQAGRDPLGPAGHADAVILSTGISYAIAIYPYMAEREDEFDVALGATFVIHSRAKGWWMVQRDSDGFGGVDENAKRGWVPAGCLLETSMAPAIAVAEVASHQRVFSVGSPSAQQAPSSRVPSADAPPPEQGGSSSLPVSRAPILPSSIVSTSFPGVGLMDYAPKGDHELDLIKGDLLRVFKRYNHWSYAVKEDSGCRGWVPSWLIGKVPTRSVPPTRGTIAGHIPTQEGK